MVVEDEVDIRLAEITPVVVVVEIGKIEINGVDVSDPTRTFSSEEMIKLDKVGRDYIFAKRGNRDQASGQNTNQQKNASETSTTSIPNLGTPQNTDNDNC